jgi:serine/threonine-protein phosphatase 2A regulatory subunit B'
MKLIQTVNRHVDSEEIRPVSKRSASLGLEPAHEVALSADGRIDKVARAQYPSMEDIESLPKLCEASLEESSELFRRKIQACSLVLDFTTDSNQQAREAKRQTLLELVEYVNNTRSRCFSESVIVDVVNMVGSNIFRTVRTRNRDPIIFSDPDPGEPMLETAWPHLHLVYEFFLRYIISNDLDPKIARRYVNVNFVLKLLELFDSEDLRERDYLKTILHRIYGKFMVMRPSVRRAIQQNFLKIIYESESHNGVGELLEVLGSIINGFALPLKEEHKDFLMKALIPLYKVKSLTSFHQQLSYCLFQYVEKDPRLSYDIITSMLRCWPVSTASKQLLFLNELEDLLELTPPSEFRLMQDVLFRRLAFCISFPHSQVAERALCFWKNHYIVGLINQNCQEIFPIILGALYRTSSDHWNNTVRSLTFQVLQLLRQADPPLFDECSARNHREEEEEEQKQQARQQKWELLHKMHQEKRG